MAARRHENVFFASRSEGYKIKIKKVSPKDVAKALYNWGGGAKLPPPWVELKQAIDAEYARLRGGA